MQCSILPDTDFQGLTSNLQGLLSVTVSGLKSRAVMRARTELCSCECDRLLSSGLQGGHDAAAVLHHDKGLRAPAVKGVPVAKGPEAPAVVEVFREARVAQKVILWVLRPHTYASEHGLLENRSVRKGVLARFVRKEL